MAAPAVALMDELVEEALLRLPPDDPASLARAALVCRRWRCLISGPSFRRRFRELHRAPAVLGLIHNLIDVEKYDFARFVPASSFRPPEACRERSGLRAVDSRHGRVLLHYDFFLGDPLGSLVVWDPVADKDWLLPTPPCRPGPHVDNWSAAVLCAAAARDGGCSHLDCYRGPFLVVFVGAYYCGSFICVYSSEDDEWSEPTYDDDSYGYFKSAQSALVGNALYSLRLKL